MVATSAPKLFGRSFKAGQKVRHAEDGRAGEVVGTFGRWAWVVWHVPTDPATPSRPETVAAWSLEPAGA